MHIGLHTYLHTEFN